MSFDRRYEPSASHFDRKLPPPPQHEPHYPDNNQFPSHQSSASPVFGNLPRGNGGFGEGFSHNNDIHCPSYMIPSPYAPISAYSNNSSRNYNNNHTFR